MRRMRISVRVSVLAIGCVLPSAAAAQDPAPPASSDPPGYEEQVEVVGVTPIHGLGLPVVKVPANVQVFTASRLTRPAPVDVPSLLAERAMSVQLSEVQGGLFQPDLLFRGFSASPLLGASEGLAVYQDGVRLNEPFGDTVMWDTLPTTAIASLNLLPGSNPLFGLNALGGAVSIRTKDGFDFPGRHVRLTTGAFGRHGLEAETGGHSSSFAYYLAGTLMHERGWRDFSPSTVRRVFGDLAWRGGASAVNVSLTVSSNDLTGNGAAPPLLLDQDRAAVFTHPDETAYDGALLTVRARRQLSARALLEGVAYFRRSGIDAFNGDAADDDDGDGDDDDDEEEGPGARGQGPGIRGQGPGAGGQGPGIRGQGPGAGGQEEDEGFFDGVNNTSRTRGRSGGVTSQVTWTAPLAGRENHFIAGLGVDAASTRFESAAELATLTPSRGTIGSGLFDEDAFVGVRSRTVTGSVFVTDTWSVTDRVALTGSARVNWTDVRLRDQIGTALTGDHAFRSVNPAGGVTWQAREWLNLYAGYTQSSRVPTPVELTCADPEDPCRLPNAFVSDPPLDQIVARTWEAGVRTSAAPVRLTLAVFSTRAHDDIVFVSSGTARGEGHFENIARTDRAGVELGAEYRRGRRVSAFGSYTLQRATFGVPLVVASPHHPDAVGLEIPVEDGDRLPGVPVHNARAGLTVAATAPLTLGLSLRAQSGLVYRGDEGNLLPEVPGFVVVDAKARHALTSRAALLLQVHNLFDSAHETFGILGNPSLISDSPDRRFLSPGAPRAAWVGVEFDF